MLKHHIYMDQAGDGSGAGAGAGGGAAAAGTPWYQGLPGVDSEMIGAITNKGWHTKSAPEAAIEAFKAYRETEHFVGVPANQLLRLPKDATDEAGWKNVWTRLGKPNDPKEYDFSTVKFSDGTPLDEAFTSQMREWAFKNNLPKDAAASVAQEFSKFLDGADAAERTEQQAQLIAEKQALAKNWGANAEANNFVATQARRALQAAMNIPDEKMAQAIQTMENSLGYATVMEMFRTIGSKIGEDKFVSNLTPGGSGVMTRDQAVAQKKDLLKDTQFRKKYLEGDTAANKQMAALDAVIVGV